MSIAVGKWCIHHMGGPDLAQYVKVDGMIRCQPGHCLAGTSG